MNELPVNCIFNKSLVGCGGTTVAIQSNKPYVITVPFKNIIKNKAIQCMDAYKKDLNAPLIFKITGYTTKEQIDKYLLRTKVPKFMVTYDSLGKLNNWIDVSQYTLLIDEVHVMFNQYDFRKMAVKNVWNNYMKYKEFCFMTATEVKAKYQLTELEHLNVVKAVWKNIIPVTIKSYHCDSVSNKAMEIIHQHLSGKDADKNAHIFINSVVFINKMVSKCKLNDSNTRAIWADGNNIPVLLRRGDTLEKAKKINFYTSMVCEGCDLYDKDGVIYIISDSAKRHTLVDVSTTMLHIIGRIRDTQYWDTVHHIYSTTRYSEKQDLTIEEFEVETNKIFEESEKTANALNSITNPEVLKYQEEKERKSNSNINYIEFDFETKKYYADKNMQKRDLHGFDISKGTYSSCKNLEIECTKTGLIVDKSVEYISEYVCETRNVKNTIIELETNPDDIELLNEAISKYPWLRDAIHILTLEGIKECDYNYNRIKQKLIVRSNKPLNGKIYNLLNSNIRISNGDFIKASLLKAVFADIYRTLGINKKPVASNITEYYQVVATNKTIENKTYGGYSIIRPIITTK
jgi:hypothetical protein